MPSECGLSIITHCLEWYKPVLHTRLSTPAVHNTSLSNKSPTIVL